MNSPSMRCLGLLSLAILLAVGTVAVAQQAPAAGDAVQPVAVNESAAPASIAPLSQSPANNAVFQTITARVDKNVAGRIVSLTPSGQFAPAKAKVSLVSDGRVIATGMSDEIGNFQIPTVPAGNYSVVAVGSAGLGVASVRVVPYQPGVASTNLLDLTLVPYADFRVVADQGPVADVPPPMMVPGPAPVAEFGAPGAGFAAGGAGGGAGGLGALLGLSGLAGLAGVSGGGGDVIIGPASPAAP